ncbi:MAG: glycosyltransferase [Candidatus Aminicenantes bacterium]|jgi:glycosyltransferase involved in cell wall biosynthesis
MPRISVVIPVYNNERTIHETVDSVLNQTFSDFELLVVDDGSQDTTIDILNAIQDPRLKIFARSHAGVSASRNYGIAHAHGDFIAFLDADDLWTPDKLEAQLKALEQNPQAAVAYSWTDFIDESGDFLHPGLHTTADGDVYDKLLTLNFIESGSNFMVRREALDDVGGFDSSIDGFEDWDMGLRLAERHHFVVVQIPQILYRRSTTSSSSDIANHEAAGLNAIEKAFSRTPRSLKHLKKKSYAWVYEYLTHKALDGPPGRRKGFLALKFLWRAIRNDPTLLMRVRLVSSLLFKIKVTILLPPRQAQRLLFGIRNLVRKRSERIRPLPY